MKTTVTELPESRVRVQVQVPAAELEHDLERKAQQLARELKLPGFRRGKVPAPLVIRRLGREAVLEQTVRDALSGWYAQAIETAGVVPVGDPELELGELPPEGQPLELSIEIGVLPRADLGGYDELEVPRREPEVDEARVEDELERMRDRLARMQAVDRPAAQGDFVIVDYRGWLVKGEGERRARGRPLPGGEARDRLVELGGGNLIPGFEEGLLGAAAGEQRALDVSFPGEYSSSELAGREATFEARVKQVCEKQLPELDEDMAGDAGFDSLDDLRADIRSQLLELEQARVEADFSQAALDAVVARASIVLPPALVSARAKEMWERMLRALARQGVSPEAYMQLSGRSEPDALDQLEPEAEQALRREAVLTALVAAEGVEVSDENLLEVLAPSAQRDEVDPAQLLDELRAAGRLEELREQEAARRAVELVAARAKPISVAAAQARERLWTPALQAPAQAPAQAPGGDPAGQLWTPGDPTPAG